MGLHGERNGQIAASEHFHEAAFGDEPAGSQRVGVDDGSGVEPGERVEVDDGVLDAERVLESLRLRCASRDGCLAAFEAGLDGVARPLAF